MIVINDLHIGSTHAIKPGAYDLITKYCHGDVVLCGDIIDLANCKKSQLKYYEKLVETLLDYFGTRYILGNHERMLGNRYFVKDRVCYAHGNWELWTKERNEMYYSGKRGAGFLKRSVLPFFDFFRLFKPFKLKPWQEENIMKLLARLDCDHYVCGHAHVIKRVEGKFYTIMPRGINHFNPSQRA